MARWIKVLLGIAMGVAAASAHAQTCTTTLNNGGNLQAAIQAAAAGNVICLNAGTYMGTTNGGGTFPANGGFAVFKNVIIRGLGATPASVVLQAQASTVDHVVYFLNLNGNNVNGAQLVNLTIQGGQGGIQLYNFTANPAGRLADIKLKDLVITTQPNASGFGVLVRDTDRLVMDNVTITSHQTALRLNDATDALVMNSDIVSTSAELAVGLAILAGSNNRIINNTIGRPRTLPGQGYSFNAGSVVIFNSSNNRFEGNVVQGMRDDAVNVSVFDLTGDGLPNVKPLNNYFGKNSITHSDFPVDNVVLHSAGIWSNCGSDGAWIFGNTVTGVAECGLCVWGSKSNMVRGNTSHNNGITGMFLSGGQEALDFCTVGGGAFRQKPTNNYIQGNAHFFNKNDQIVVRNADNTEISRNFSHPRSGFGGTTQGCINFGCQSAFSIETDGSMFGTTNGTTILANTSVDNLRGLWGDYVNIPSIGFALNRTIGSANMRWLTGSAQTIDLGSILGGNQWSNHIPTGNPSTGSQPFTGIFHNLANQTGNIVDHYPYQTEDLGRGYNITVYEPLANSSVARGTRRTVRWDSIGCFWIDLTLNGATLASNVPNTGYHIVTIPATGLGPTFVVATCKDRSGVVRSSANSPTFTVTNSTLTLVSPGREEVYNTGQQVWVGWKNTDRATNTSVIIEYSPDAGGTWPTTLATVSNQNTTTAVVSSTRVTLPGTASGNAMIRVRSSGTVIDQTDGVFSLRGVAGALTNVSAGRIFRMGQMERLEWSSPQNSRLVTIVATSGNTVTVATDLPDRGSHDWIVPGFTPGALAITLTFKNDAGAVLSSVTNLSAGVTRYPTTITFGNPPSAQPGQSGPLPVTVNSGGAFSLTSTTPGICSVSAPNTINILSNGTCGITANAGASGNYAAALPVTTSFTTGQTQTITFGMPQFVAVSSSITLSATASSGLAVVFTSLTPAVCAVVGNTLTVITNGMCTVAANQPGGGSFGAAPQVTDTAQAVPGSDVPRLMNISTRGLVQTGDNVMIGGFIIEGNAPKNVVIRARGPSLAALGVPGVLANPILQLFSGQTQIDSNDNWQAHPNAAQVISSTFAPTNPNEAAIFTTIGPGAFTAIVTGAGGGTGIAIVEVFEVDGPDRQLINISTRGFVSTGDNVMIGGFIIGGTTNQTVLVRARGPSLTALGVPGALANPTLEIYSGQTLVASNDNWQTNFNASAIQATGNAPTDANESAVLASLPPGPYTAIVRGVGNNSGVGIVEVFAVP